MHTASGSTQPSHSGEEERERDVGKRYVDTVGEGEGGMYPETGIDVYMLPCVKEITSGKLMYSTGS